MENVIVSIFLAIGTVWDIKKHNLPGKYLLVWSVVNILYLCVMSMIDGNNVLFMQALWGVLPGIVCLFLAYVSGEQIGYGDGLVLVLTGTLLGVEIVLAIVLVALSILICFSMILLVTKKARRKTQIPFLPFLLLGEIFISLFGRFSW